MAELGTFKPVTLTKNCSYLTIKPLAHSRIYIFLLYAPVKRVAFMFNPNMFNPHLSGERLSNNLCLSLQLRLSVNTSRAQPTKTRTTTLQKNSLSQTAATIHLMEEDFTINNDDIRKQTDQAGTSEQDDIIL